MPSNTPRKRHVPVFVALAFLGVALAGCMHGDRDDTGGQGNLQAFVRGAGGGSGAPDIGAIATHQPQQTIEAESEAESEVNIESIDATVTRIEARTSAESRVTVETGGEEEPTFEGEEPRFTGDTSGDVVVILDDEEAVELHDEPEFVAEADVEPGVFKTISVTISELRVTTDDGCEIVIVLEDLTISVSGNFIVRGDETTQVLIELGAARAVVESGAVECPPEGDGGGDGGDGDVTPEQDDDEPRRVTNVNIHIEVHQTLVVNQVTFISETTNRFDEDNARDADDPELEREADEFEGRGEGEGEAKVTVCHYPQGDETGDTNNTTEEADGNETGDELDNGTTSEDTTRPHNITIAETAVDAHLEEHEGDHRGACTDEDFEAFAESQAEAEAEGAVEE
ncbi:MAG: hypothetical protein KY455_03995 [Euryarchaeota archaeon]|nr:hypothetical protein [Euryarchaeota archaeon]